jgi:hypothetical protein
MLRDAPAPVLVWTIGLGLMGVLNLWLWRRVGAGLTRDEGDMAPGERGYRDRQLLFAATFTIGCAFRSIWPRADVQRIVLHDTFLSSVALGRAVATVAEMAFAAQWALLLRDAGRSLRIRAVTFLSSLLLPIIAVAEGWSWYAVLTTNFIGNVVEQSLWTGTSLLVMAGLGLLWLAHPPRRRYLGSALTLLAAYFVFMCAVDVPMYWYRHRADEIAGRPYLSLAAGWGDAVRRRVVTYSVEDWREEIPWMTLYFSAGVWVSLSLVRAPRFASVRASGGGS